MGSLRSLRASSARALVVACASVAFTSVAQGEAAFLPLDVASGQFVIPCSVQDTGSALQIHGSTQSPSSLQNAGFRIDYDPITDTSAIASSLAFIPVAEASDGTVVGYSWSYVGGSWQTRAQVQYPNQSPVDLSSGTTSIVRNISAEGGVSVGRATELNMAAFWMGNNSRVTLNNPPGTTADAAAYTDSAFIVVGHNSTDSYVWDLNTANSAIALNLPVVEHVTTANLNLRNDLPVMSLTSDGRYIATNTPIFGGGLTEAVRFDLQSGDPISRIGVLDPSTDTFSFSTGISADGRYVVGYSGSGPIDTIDCSAFIWQDTETGGELLSLADYLAGVSQDLANEFAGWSLTAATYISPDASLLAGIGFDDTGVQRGWVVYGLAGSTPPPPQPVDFTWSASSSDSNFENADNWTPVLRAPGSVDSAIFDGGNDFEHVVDVNQCTTLASLQVKHDNLVLDLHGNSLTLQPTGLDNDYRTQLSIGVEWDQTPQNSTLTLRNGELFATSDANISLGFVGATRLNIEADARAVLLSTVSVGPADTTIDVAGELLVQALWMNMGTLNVHGAGAVASTVIYAPPGDERYLGDTLGVTVVGDGGAASLNVLDGGTYLSGELMSIGRGYMGQGSVLVSGGKSYLKIGRSVDDGWYNPASLYVGDTTTGTLTVADGGSVHVVGAMNVGASTGTDLRPASQGYVYVGETTGQTPSSLISTLSVDDRIVIAGHAAFDPDMPWGYPAAAGGSGLLAVGPDGQVHVGRDMWVYAGGIVQLMDGSISLGEISSVEAVLTLDEGKLEGRGTIYGSVHNLGGEVSPGFSPGTIRISGDYLQDADGLLRMEIAGTDPGTYDQLIIEGDGELHGALIISFDGFQPQPLDSITLIQAFGSLSSDMQVSVEGLDQNLTYLTELASGLFTITVVAVPEPAGLSMLAFGAVLGMRRRR